MRPWRILVSMGAVAFRDMVTTLLRPKTLITAASIGIVVILAAWFLSNAALDFSQLPPPEPPDEPPVPALWHMGSDGALVTLAFGIIPLILPLLPIITLSDTISLDQSSGFFERSLHRPVPRWSFALARTGGAFAALAIPTAAFFLVGAFLIPTIAPGTVTPGLILAFLGTTILLLALYTALALFLAIRFSAGITLGLLLLLWIVFNALSPGAFILGGQFLLIVPIRGPQTFQPAFADTGTLTGVYLGLVARFIPADLGFIATPGVADWPALVSGWAATLMNVPWLIFLVIFFVLLHHRYHVA